MLEHDSTIGHKIAEGVFLSIVAGFRPKGGAFGMVDTGRCGW